MRRYLKGIWVTAQSGRQREGPVFHRHCRTGKWVKAEHRHLSLSLSVFYKSYSGLLVLLLLWGFERGRERGGEGKRRVGYCWSIMANFIGWGEVVFMFWQALRFLDLGRPVKCHFQLSLRFFSPYKQTHTLLSSFLLSFPFLFFNVIR